MRTDWKSMEQLEQESKARLQTLPRVAGKRRYRIPTSILWVNEG